MSTNYLRKKATLMKKDVNYTVFIFTTHKTYLKKTHAILMKKRRIMVVTAFFRNKFEKLRRNAKISGTYGENRTLYGFFHKSGLLFLE